MDFFTTVPHSNKSVSLSLTLSFLLFISLYAASTSSQPNNSTPLLQQLHDTAGNCDDITKFSDYRSKCAYVKSNSSCKKGYLNYLQIFYCLCGDSPAVGYLLLLLWLIVLFYVLGNTTAEYFCPSVESLSRVLKLSPTIAGTTLLPLGNGANDVFSIVIAFTRSGDADVGLNSVLGGAFFVSCFVVGVVSIAISSREIRVERPSFVRDVLFFLFVLCCVIMISIFGRINFIFAFCFFCVYFLYIALVSVMQFFRRKEERAREMEVPLLGYVGVEKGSFSDKDGRKIQVQELEKSSYCQCHYFTIMLCVLELPLSLPRRLTIPDLREENWSKPFAVASSTLAPILIGALCIVQQEIIDSQTSLAVWIASASVGIILGAAALVFTESSAPPREGGYSRGCAAVS